MYISLYWQGPKFLATTCSKKFAVPQYKFDANEEEIEKLIKDDDCHNGAIELTSLNRTVAKYDGDHITGKDVERKKLIMTKSISLHLDDNREEKSAFTQPRGQRSFCPMGKGRCLHTAKSKHKKGKIITVDSNIGIICKIHLITTHYINVYQ